MWSIPHKAIYVSMEYTPKVIYVLECHMWSISHNANYVIGREEFVNKRRVFHINCYGYNLLLCVTNKKLLV